MNVAVREFLDQVNWKVERPAVSVDPSPRLRRRGEMERQLLGCRCSATSYLQSCRQTIHTVAHHTRELGPSVDPSFLAWLLLGLSRSTEKGNQCAT